MPTNSSFSDPSGTFNLAAFTPATSYVDAMSANEASGKGGPFIPREPTTLAETELTQAVIESLILKFLYSYGSKSGVAIANQIKLPFKIVEEILHYLKHQMLIGHRSAAELGDFVYQVTETGVLRAQRLMEHCSYCGSAPVSLEEYCAAVRQQSLRGSEVEFSKIREVYNDMIIDTTTVAQIGQAVSAARCLLLYGPPGNGKTSVARRAIQAFSEAIWIPRTITTGGEVIRLFDNNVHQEIPAPVSERHGMKAVDRRWVMIKRPSVVVGGELSFDHLEAKTNPVTGIVEAPIHLKSNCGCLVVDDFGRQRISTVELLNRWIVPLERGEDYLSLPNGRHIEVPFNQLLMFSTNLEPKVLCDEAFLRRIPYKIEMRNPTDSQFTSLLALRAEAHGFQITDDLTQHLITKHFREKNRILRFCFAEDLMQHCEEFCNFHKIPKKLTKELIDFAALTYFANS
jgi:predicted ATPase with chaperone activity